MMRRMSSSFDRSRKALGNAISSTLHEETEPQQLLDVKLPQASISQPSLASMEIGDVNVQFPDGLLWKRRHVLLDGEGFLVLSAASQNSSKVLVGTKRYHMRDLRKPFIPDMEMQELPNSVSLEFVAGGGGLQFACEDRAGQSHVLHRKFLFSFFFVCGGFLCQASHWIFGFFFC